MTKPSNRALFLMGQSRRRLGEHPSPRRWLWKERRYARMLKRELARLRQEGDELRKELGIPDNHVMFDLEVDGQAYPVLGDPDMKDETRQALAELIRAAMRAIENGEIGGEDE